MIRVGPLVGPRLRAGGIALRIRWVEEVERQRDDANARARALEVERDQARRDLAAAQAHASHWRRDVAALVGVQSKGTSDSDLLSRLEARVGGDPGTILATWRQVCGLVDDTGILSPASVVDRVAMAVQRQGDPAHRSAYLDDVERQRDEAESERARADRELRDALDVLAPDLDTGDATLPEVARAALAAARSAAVAAELRWWAEHGAVEDFWLTRRFRGRAQQLDPSGVTPEGDEPPTPSIFRKPTDEEIAAEVRATARVPRARPATTTTLTFGAAVADHEPVPVGDDDVVDTTIMCGFPADGVECGGRDGHPGGCWPAPRALARRALIDGGVPLGAAAAAQVLDEAHLLGDRGMTVDGDMLHAVVSEALPRWASDEFARELADLVLDQAVRAGMTVLHGPALLPRVLS